MILGKKQVILSCLVLALGIAVYLNWRIVDNEDYQLSETLTPNTQTTEDGKKYGDSKLVDSQGLEDDDATMVEGSAYFAEARLSRERSRDEAVETLQVMLQDESIDAETRSALALQATEIAKSIEAEGKVENLIKAKGFEECMVYLDDTKASIVVKTSGLLDNEAAQIKDIILKESNVAVENISIVEIP